MHPGVQYLPKEKKKVQKGRSHAIATPDFMVLSVIVVVVHGDVQVLVQQR
jgi:hypothetical protein